MTKTICLLACIGLLAAACGKSKSDSAAAAGADKPDQVYTVRGVLETLPDRDGKITIHHEAIPDFINMEGKRNGMPSMSMPFEVAENVSLSGFAVGDKIEFTLEVRWKAPEVLSIPRITKL